MFYMSWILLVKKFHDSYVMFLVVTVKYLTIFYAENPVPLVIVESETNGSLTWS